MDETEGHYAEWNKPGTERQIFHDLTYVECRTIKFVETEYRMVVTRVWGSGDEEERWDVSQRVQISGYVGWINLEIECTARWL